MPLSRNSRQNLEKSVEALENLQSFFVGDAEALEINKDEFKSQRQASSSERTLGSSKK